MLLNTRYALGTMLHVLHTLPKLTKLIIIQDREMKLRVAKNFVKHTCAVQHHLNSSRLDSEALFFSSSLCFLLEPKDQEVSRGSEIRKSPSSHGAILVQLCDPLLL